MDLKSLAKIIAILLAILAMAGCLQKDAPAPLETNEALDRIENATVSLNLTRLNETITVANLSISKASNGRINASVSYGRKHGVKQSKCYVDIGKNITVFAEKEMPIYYESNSSKWTFQKTIPANTGLVRVVVSGKEKQIIWIFDSKTLFFIT